MNPGVEGRPGLECCLLEGWRDGSSLNMTPGITKKPVAGHWLFAVACSLLLGCVATPNAEGAALSEADRATLRKLAKLPMIEIQSGFGLKTGGPDGNFGFWSERDLQVEREKLVAVESERRDDPRYWLQRARVLGDLDHETERNRLNAKALALAERLKLAESADSEQQVLLAEVLMANEQLEKAEELLRKLITANPEDWRAWIELGNCLNRKTLSRLEQAKPSAYGEGDASQDASGQPRSTWHRLQELKPEFEAAWRCFDRAVELAPAESKPYIDRVQARFLFLLHQSNAPGESWPEDGWRRAQADLQKWAELEPDSIPARFLSVLVAVLPRQAAARRASVANPESNAGGLLSTDDRAEITNALEQLEGIASRSSATEAAKCFSLKSLFQIVLSADETDDSPMTGQIRRDAERAVELDPLRTECWEILIGFHGPDSEVDHEAALPFAEGYAKHAPSGRAHLYLAKVYEGLGRDADGARAIESGLKLEPDNVYLLMGKAALQLKSEADSALVDATQSLQKAKLALDQQLSAAERGSEQIKELRAMAVEMWKLVALLYGLEGDKPEATKFAKRALEMDPDDERASEILAALNALPDQPRKEATGLDLE